MKIINGSFIYMCTLKVMPLATTFDDEEVNVALLFIEG